MTRSRRTASHTSRPARSWRRLRRTVLARRRLLAAVLAGLAVLVAVRAHAAPPPPTAAVLVAAHDLAAGAVLTAADLTTVELPPEAVPSGAVRRPAAIGRTTTGPVRAGEPLTDARLVHGDLLAGYPGLVAAPVRIGDPGAVRLLRVGDHVTLVAADPQGESEPVEAATDVPVVAVPRDRNDSAGLVGGALLVVAVPADTARRLAGLATSAYLHALIVR